MPRRKKNGHSPARVQSGPSEEGSLGHSTSTGYRLPHVYDGDMANNFASSTVPCSVKEKIVKSMQEMFSHLDPEVIYIVLSECDFKVENAMDSLLELSVAAEDVAPLPSNTSGFERTAAELLRSQHLSQPEPDPEPSKPSRLSSPLLPTTILTEELDLLIDQELETLTLQSDIKEEYPSSQQVASGAPLTSFPPPPVPQQILPELLQSSLEPGAKGNPPEHPCPGGGLVTQTARASSPLDQLSFCGGENIGGQHSVVDFTHLTTETDTDKPKPPLDLAASGRPSAFQVYKKQDPSQTPSERAGVKPSEEIGGARSKVSMASQEPLGYVPSSWNLAAPAFYPHIHGNQGPSFITPVVQTPSTWASKVRHASRWPNASPVSQAPLKPSATIPKSWALPAAPQLSIAHSKLRLEGKVLVLLRGPPGCGKTTLARALLEHNPGGAALSTDDYFVHNGKYHFDPTAVGEAHEWNYKRAKEAFENGANPIIIDNTNMQGWEMKPYVVQAMKYKYKILFKEPDTWWKNKPKELERRTTHNVPAEKIRRMLNGYERYITVQSIMGSQAPERKQRPLLDGSSSQPVSSETCRPDLVGEYGLTEGCKKSCPQLCSSLPDVSSVDHSGEMGKVEESNHNSAESLDIHSSERLEENFEIPGGDDEMDLGSLDSELEAHFELNHPSGDHVIPDCIVESVLNEDHHGGEMAFSQSIGQRVKRERGRKRSDFDKLEPADLVKDTNQSEKEGEEDEGMTDKGAEGADMVRDRGEKGRPELLDFVGDWPSEGSLEQRQVRRRERQRHQEQNQNEDGGESEAADYHENTMKVKSGPDVTEIQKLLDLIQTGIATIQTDSSLDASLSPCSGEELEREEDLGSRFQEAHGTISHSEEGEEGRNRVNNSRTELPDCVLDWKAADSCVDKKMRMGDWEAVELEKGGSSSSGEKDNILDIGRETGAMDLESDNPTSSLSAPSADLLVGSEIMDPNVCHDGVGRQNGREAGAEVGVDHTDMDAHISEESETLTESRVMADGSHIDDICQSPACETSVEAECTHFSGGSQERKQRQGRRLGKSCKLALTFTQNCSTSLETLKDSTIVQNLESSQESMKRDVELNFNSNCNPSLNPKPNFDLYNDPIPKPSPETHTPQVDTGCSSQTEPQDFALLWRLNRQDSLDEKVISTYPSNITVLSCDSSRFVPELSGTVSAAVAVHPSDHREVPYRVVHEKGTQVEEKEVEATQGRLESLRILSCHFKLVSFDTLEDLYDKCHQDLEWTTNLLLDSGERFFRDEDGAGGDDQNASTLCGGLDVALDTRLRSSVLDDLHSEGLPKTGPASLVEVIQDSTCGTVIESGESSSNTDLINFGDAVSSITNKDHLDTTSHNLIKPEKEGERCTDTKHKETDLEDGAWGRSLNNGAIVEESRFDAEDDIPSMNEIHRLLQAELEELEREGALKKEERPERRHWEERSLHLDIQSVELKLPTELALQLTELFGPVGIDPGTCSTDDYAVQMDLNLAKLLHQKWKETIQERQRQATLSYHLLQESLVHVNESQVTKTEPRERTQPTQLTSVDGFISLNNQPDAYGVMPFMDHWSVSRPHVSLRDIIKEEQALQQSVEKTRQSRADLDRRNGATLLKENQLYSLFPTIDKHFLHDIFRDHNYCLTQTELFLRSLLHEEPVKTVVAPESPRSDHHRTASREREKRQKPVESAVFQYQDTEDPQYEDFRAEASLQRNRQIECFSKAAEAYKQGRKEVASFYAQQGHLHGQRMREANHRAASQIFERVNSSLLPSNILDLHGLHVDEALQHLAEVLQNKITEYEQGLCRPQLSVITGRGNHSQGGVARIRPAVIDYLTNKHYRFTEPKPGLVLVSLK